jgi:hypothetical protein
MKKNENEPDADNPNESVIAVGFFEIRSDGSVVHQIIIDFPFKNSEEAYELYITSDEPISLFTDEVLGVDGIHIISNNYLEVQRLLSNRFLMPKTDEDDYDIWRAAMDTVVKYVKSKAQQKKIDLN